VSQDMHYKITNNMRIARVHVYQVLATLLSPPLYGHRSTQWIKLHLIIFFASIIICMKSK